MLEWLKGLMGKRGEDAPDVHASVELAPETLHALREDLQALADGAPGLADRLLQYALSGAHPTALSQLRGANQTGRQHLLAHVGVAGPGSPRRRLFRGTLPQDVPFLLRLAHIYDAWAGGSPPITPFGLPGIIEHFLIAAVQFPINSWPKCCIKASLAAQTVEQMLVAMDAPPDALVRAAFLTDPSDWQCHDRHELLLNLANPEASIFRHGAPVLEALRSSKHPVRMRALELLGRLDAPARPFAEAVVECAVGNSAQAREAALALLRRLKGDAVPHLRAQAVSGKPDARIHAANLLRDIDPEAEAYLRERLQTEKAARVREAIQRALGGANEVIAAGESPTHAPEPIALPPISPVDPVAPLPEEVLAEFRALLEEARRQKHLNMEKNRKAGMVFRSEYVREIDVAASIALLQGLTAKQGSGSEIDACLRRAWDYVRVDERRLRSFLAHREVKPIHALRAIMLTHTSGGGWCNEPLIRHYLATHGMADTFGLRELAVVLQALRVDTDSIAWLRLNRWYDSLCWDDHLVWPYFAEREYLLAGLIGAAERPARVRQHEVADYRRQALAILATFPVPPARLIPTLWEAALGPSSTEAPLAMQALRGAHDRDARLLLALGNGKQDARTAAATWLGRFGVREAVEPLMAALKKEKQETAKVAMMNALEVLGVPLDDFLDRGALLDEARAGLKTGIPGALAWFPFAALPTVHWADTGEALPTEVPTWWVVQALKLKNPAPSALLRCYTRLLRREDREALGLFVLTAWTDHDAEPAYTREQAEQLARPQVAQWKQWQPDRSEERILRMLMNGYLDQCKGSAIKEKGILAVAAACGGPGTWPVVHRYLRRWYGMRAAQCKALLPVLAWADHDTATQVLVAVATRFRTKSIREEAEALVRDLAERRGWTVDELADRTIPAAGFEDDGTQVLSYGDRSFTASLAADLEIVLTDETGKTITALPDPRKDDDAEAAKTARAQLSQARKELKSAVTLQKSRLYEAMCTERAWRFDDWQAYLCGHPIAGRLCARLVWAAADGDAVQATLRPLGDGTFTDIDDNPVILSADAHIRLAHSSLVSAEVGQAWTQHLAEYEVTPLFDQFARPFYVLPPEKRHDTELDVFRGHMLTAFRLRARATALGYTRGETGDGGYFTTYTKHFPGLGLDAVLEFTGNSVPEGDRPVALCHLSLQRPGGSAVSLGRVPAVLLSECWNDLRLIAAEGTGHDPEWERKAYV